MSQRLFAFWRYDLFPYCLGSEVDEVLDGGRVKVKGYGGGVFRHIAILPYAEGKAKLDALEKLRAEYTRAKDKLHEEFLARKKEILP